MQKGVGNHRRQTEKHESVGEASSRSTIRLKSEKGHGFRHREQVIVRCYVAKRPKVGTKKSIRLVRPIY